MLTWSPPDNPNGIILRYEMYRNDTLAYTGLNRKFNDTGLTPDTVYYYYIITYTESGQTRSLDDGYNHPDAANTSGFPAGTKCDVTSGRYCSEGRMGQANRAER